MGAESGFGDLFGGERLELLAIVFVDAKGEADAVEADLDGLGGVVAKRNLNGEKARGEGRFLGERFFVLRGVEPGPGGNGQAFVGFESGGADRRRLLSESESGNEIRGEQGWDGAC